MTRLLVSSLLFMLSLPCEAQITIEGKVLNKKKKAVAGASITLKDTYDGATSDSTGHYHFTTSEKGRQVLEITGTGYKTADITLILGADTLQQQVILQDNIT